MTDSLVSVVILPSEKKSPCIPFHHITIKYRQFTMKNKYTDAPAERKWNYIFLLHARYKGSFARLARAMGIPQAELKNWDAEYKEDVMQWIDNEKKQAGYTAGENPDDGPVPDEGQLIEMIMRRLGGTIRAETDPSKLTRALDNLHQLQANKGAKNPSSTCSKVTQAIEERLKKGGKNE